MHKSTVFAFAAIVIAASLSGAQNIQLPLNKDSAKFAVIGDNGTGGKAEYQMADKLAAIHMKFPFEFVLMMGDNLYGGESPGDLYKSSKSHSNRFSMSA